MLTIAIQAGGESRRMGQDKALMPFLDRPLIQHIVDRLAPIAGEVIVTTNRPQAYQFLNLPLFPDLKPGRGALGGLFTALSAAAFPVVGVIACDMPFASVTLIKTASRLLIEDGVDVVIPKSSEGLEPLHAVYRQETCQPAIQAAIAADQWKLIEWLSWVKVRVLLPEEIKELDPSGMAFHNLNTPKDFAEAEQHARLHL